MRRPKLHEALAVDATRRFYEWEKRGRGDSLYPFEVDLEPPFGPFRPGTSQPGIIDDVRRHTVRSWVAGLFEQDKSEAPRLPPPSREPESPARGELLEARLMLPQELRPPREAAEGFLKALLALSCPLSWEISGEAGVVRYGVALERRDEAALRAALAAFFPAVSLGNAHALSPGWAKEEECLVEDFALAREFVVPLGVGLQPDPLLSLLALFAGTSVDECIVLQVRFVPTRSPWRSSILRAVRTPAGEPFFADAPEVTRQAEEKCAEPFFAVGVRLAVRARTRERRSELFRVAKRSLGTIGTDNHLRALGHDPNAREDFRRRESHRAGMLLSLSELAALVHFPGPEVALPGIERGGRKEREAPREASSGGVLLGEVSCRDKRSPVFLREEARLKHTHVLGATGTGKTTLLFHLILEDLRAGRGVALIDPHGDLAQAVLPRIPESRLSELVYLDPSEPELSTGWNALDAKSDTEREVLSSDLVALWRRYATSWGDQMSCLLENAVATLLALPGSYSISDLRRFLVDREWRDSLVARIRDPELRFFWQKEFGHIGERSLGPILGRLNTFLRSRPIRESVSEEPGLDFRSLVDRGGVLIARLPLGALGEENVAVLGSLLVSKLHQVALSRVDQRPEERRPFFLYLDEFHLFATPSLSMLLSGARKFGLALTLAHQSLASLRGPLAEVEASILANAYTRIMFRVGEEDARKLERGLSYFDAGDLLGLQTGEAICRLGRQENDFRLRVTEPEKLSADEEHFRGEAVRSVLRLARASRKPTEPTASTESPSLLGTAAPEKDGSPSSGKEIECAESLGSATDFSRRLGPSGGGRPLREREDRRVSLPLGRGGAEHKYLQELVKQWAEAHSFAAVIEKPVLQGAGSVDVVLERAGWTLACEISVTSTVEQEVGNVEKCLLAGFSEVAVVSAKKRFLQQLRSALEERIPRESLSRLHLFSLDEFLAYLESRPTPEEAVESVGGYRVRVAYRPPADDEGEARRRALARVLAESLRRIKGPTEGK